MTRPETAAPEGWPCARCKYARKAERFADGAKRAEAEGDMVAVGVLIATAIEFVQLAKLLPGCAKCEPTE